MNLLEIPFNLKMKFTSHKKLLRTFFKSLIITSTFFSSAIAFGNPPPIKITILPNQPGLITSIIQKAIDSCGANGGGVVYFPAGKYITGGIVLKSRVTLLTEIGTLIEGSSSYLDYKNDAFVFGENLTNIAIVGKGVIDGVDCNNPDGEEGFRGPHCIRLINCKNISIEEINIINSANWAMNFRYCSNAYIENISIRGGHDGLHTRFCNNFTVTGCDFRTGDDAFAGNDNRDFLVTDCKINTSCNGFRIGCYNFTVKRCKFWGPGEYVHKIAKRRNMLTAFVHFSPKDDGAKMISGNWLIEDIIVENVDHLYMYNFEDGLWQTGKPVTNLRFKNIKATGLLNAFSITGDRQLQFNLSIKNSIFSFREGATYLSDSFEGVKIASHTFFNATNFNKLKLQKLTLVKKGAAPILKCTTGNLIVLKQIKFITNQNTPTYSITDVKKVHLDSPKAAGTEKLNY